MGEQGFEVWSENLRARALLLDLVSDLTNGVSRLDGPTFLSDALWRSPTHLAHQLFLASVRVSSTVPVPLATIPSPLCPQVDVAVISTVISGVTVYHDQTSRTCFCIIAAHRSLPFRYANTLMLTTCVRHPLVLLSM